MKRGTRLAISIVAGIAAALVAFAYVSSVRSEAEAERQEALARYGGELVAVCVATQDIEPGDTLGEGNVAVEEWVSSLLPPDAFTSLADVTGKIATSRIPQRSVLCPPYLESQSDAIEVPDGTVAVCVASDPAHAVGGALERGNEVDVYVAQGGIADRLLGARVLDTSSLASGGGDLSWVTIAVEPERVEELLAAMAQGQITLVAPGDSASGDKEPPDKDGQSDADEAATR